MSLLLYMNKSPRSYTLGAILLFCVGVICYSIWPKPNWMARRQVRYELLRSADHPAAYTLNRLEPYVRVGVNINTVKRRLFPSFENKVYNRPATLQLGLDGVNLVLAIERGGRVTGIGRNIREKDDGEVWFAPPQWSKP